MAHKKVAIVDDEGEVAEILQRYLQMKGFEVSCANTADQAVELLKNDPPRQWVIDVRLPGMDGVSLAKKIKHYDPTAVIFLITGFPYEKILPDIAKSDVEQLIEKPIDPRLLVELLELEVSA